MTYQREIESQKVNKIFFTIYLFIIYYYYYYYYLIWDKNPTLA